MLPFPRTSIRRNGLTLHLYLPDPKEGFYRATRFDWSGMVGWAEFDGHTYFGPWRTPHDPAVYEHGVGTAEEFGLEGAPPLFAEAALGEPFVKIGVGVLRKTTEQYDFKEPYPFVEVGKWEVDVQEAAITFKQKLSHGAVGYEYQKTIEILDEPAGTFQVSHTLYNTGTVPLNTTHYSHAFIRVDDQPIGPQYEVHLPFDSGVHNVTIEEAGHATVRNSTIRFLKPVAPGVRLWSPLHNWDASDTDHAAFAVVHKGSNAGVRVRLDKAPVTFNFYAEATAACPEPFVALSLAPGEEETWSSTWTLGPAAAVALA